MKKLCYYNSQQTENELNVYWNTKEEITFHIDDGIPSSISLTVEDVKDLIVDLQKILEYAD